ncbi:(d)CMP kinase [Parvibaculum sp.]|uniref:(d)CMP kinase n=1 Tax=Parvibaculum sp. TaxID=2024848 RepID=UPI001B0207D8|nr:(d)CMP kinase [Parvibaculum sp.]MBO6632965.1 (d)CMP kinase [Parvibaculum sp.]MBO6677744.1 (d)CMP kinase [Parvibaculum sp.]MBO6684741.1 (d)CMP kinase [Parvibaculum sp.]MBO6903335.1 (d)CMP kinase [Parvibaculum sp.]
MTQPRGTVIAVDGPAASGKGTLARKLAAHYGFAYLDTGSLYRAVGHAVRAGGGDPADEAAALAAAQALDITKIDEKAIRTPEAGEAASLVAAMPPVRAAILHFQRNFAENPPDGKTGAVLDGRDIGTVVCPSAQAKLFVVASPQVRAHRRWLELKNSGSQVSEAQVLEDIEERDRRDAARAASPMKPAADAHLLDTSDLSIEAAFGAAVAIIDKAMG